MKMNTDKENSEAIAKAIANKFAHYIYVKPYVFSFLQTLSISLPVSAEEMDWDSQYLVTTKKFHSRNRNSGFSHFVTDEITAKAIKDLLRNDVQYMFPTKKGLPFDEKESILTIDGITIPVRHDDVRFKICKLLFGDKKTFGKRWGLDEFILESELDNPDVIDNHYRYLQPKIRHLNEKIGELAEIEDLIIIGKYSVGINPTYLPKFLN